MTGFSLVDSSKVREYSQPWLSSAAWDGLVIIAPAFLASFAALAFRTQLESYPNLPLWGWICFVLFVDVAHVYATLFRTYLDKEALRKNGTLLLAIPLACFACGCLLYSLDGLWFWRALAYLAVFHFIRQQYGFVALYSRKDPAPFQPYRMLDALIVYMATLYPLLFWHTNLPRNFSWFVEGDFASIIPSVCAELGLAVYAIVAVLYLIKETVLWKTTGFFNAARNLIIMGTALSWWVGIVAINSDFAFTMTNVLSHGIPYMGLIWLYHHKRSNESISIDKQAGSSRMLWKVANFAMTYAPVFLMALLLLAYLEEGLWDGFIWREHTALFAAFSHLPSITDPTILSFLIPLLALPQSTHYVLDGFIWRVKDQTSIWSA